MFYLNLVRIISHIDIGICTIQDYHIIGNYLIFSNFQYVAHLYILIFVIKPNILMILINALINILLQLKLLENFEGIGNEYK
jgi:hypothetical protein